jgi:hypothetical protein
MSYAPGEWLIHWWEDRRNAERHLREIDMTFAQVEAMARHLVETHWATIRTKMVIVHLDRGAWLCARRPTLTGI